MCDLIVVKMLRLWATNLSRCVGFRQGVTLCVCVTQLLSRCLTFGQLTVRQGVTVTFCCFVLGT